jgi:mono/diheme cytochrome c family protein
MTCRLVSVACVVAGLWTYGAAAQTPYSGGDARAGEELSRQVCTACHVVAADQREPRHNFGAPDFVDIADAPAVTATSLAAFLRTPHPSMPNLILSSDEMRDVIAYILSLRSRQ